jgi:purine-nucleoside phosphorylase
MSFRALQSRSDEIVIPVKGKNSPNLGTAVVMVSSQADLDLLCGLPNLDKEKSRSLFLSRLYTANKVEKSFSVVGPFMGAPYATILLETLISWGAEKIIFFGWCGAISHDVKIGDIIIPTGAIIDEGTSKHYDQGEDGVSRPSSYILKNTKEALKKADLAFHEGPVWSTDAIYRETCEKVIYYQEKDVLAVEMELSALFTVGKFRNVQMGGILVVSDELSTLTWRPGFREQRFKESRKAVVEVIKALGNLLSKESTP